jgi:hypothetical protein
VMMSARDGAGLIGREPLFGQCEATFIRARKHIARLDQVGSFTGSAALMILPWRYAPTRTVRSSGA